MGKPKDKTSIAELEGKLRALRNVLTDIQEQLAQVRMRLVKLEVVRAPSPTVEPDPQEPQLPETE